MESIQRLKIASRVLDLMAEDHVIVHSDLHPANLLVRGGTVQAVVDFEDAFAGSLAWEFATWAKFWGWSMCDVLLEAYSRVVNVPPSLSKDVAALGVTFGLYRLHAERRGLLTPCGVHPIKFVWQAVERL
jgi:aminoglycoside phosphotransferase (APT) family kinase protein